MEILDFEAQFETSIVILPKIMKQNQAYMISGWRKSRTIIIPFTHYASKRKKERE